MLVQYAGVFAIHIGSEGYPSTQLLGTPLITMQIFGVKTENNQERIVKSVFVLEYSSQILQN